MYVNVAVELFFYRESCSLSSEKRSLPRVAPTMTTPSRTLAIVYSDECTVECEVGNSDSFEQLFRIAVDALAPW